MNGLDLFSGQKGWTNPFEERGHTIITVDNNPELKPDLCRDVLTLTAEDFEQYGHFNIVFASPPCTEFSKASLPKSWASVRKYGCNPNTLLLEHTLQLIKDLDPDFWIIENVRGAIPYFKPFLGDPVKKIGSRYLWGKMPMFDSFPKYGKWKINPSKDRPAIRSKIPRQISLALCMALEVSVSSQEFKEVKK